MTTLDVVPTMIDMVGGNSNAYCPLDGDSLANLLRGTDKKLDRDAVYLYRSYDDQYAAMRAGKWKLLARRSREHELYNLKKDLSETTNLLQAEPKRARTMLEKLAGWEDEMGVRLDGKN